MTQRTKLLTASTCLIVFFLLCFWKVIFGEEQFFFRDSGFFYYPLFEQIQRCWESGSWPLWDSLENLGQPLMANPTSSVFYPLKLIFFLDSLNIASYDFCYKWYILIHYPIAFAGMYLLIRDWRLSRPAAIIAALAWTAGGSIWFLACNPVFLIGAAWLPWSIRFGDQTIRRKLPFDRKEALNREEISNRPVRYPPLIKLALTLAFMILGGDPETAYLAGLLLFGLLCFRVKETSKHSTPSDKTVNSVELIPSASDEKHPFWAGLLSLTAAGILTGLFSAVTLLPAAVMERNSDRMLDRSPVSLWEVPGACYNQMKKDASAETTGTDTVSLTDGFLCRQLQEQGHRQSIYHFSLGPWRLLELFFPNIGGDWQTGNSRWFMFFPHENQIWVPSLYMGIIPFLLALSCLFISRRSSQNAFLSNVPRRLLMGTVLLALLASFGGYGLVWFFRLIGLFFGSNQDMTLSDHDPIGGIYWLMNLLLPKFSTFRYPAKLMTFAAFGIAVLAGLGWDTFFSATSSLPVKKGAAGKGAADKGAAGKTKNKTGNVQTEPVGIYPVFRRLVLIFVILTAGLLIVIGLWGLPLMEPLGRKIVSGFAPFNVTATWRLVCQSLFHAMIVVLLFLILIRVAGKKPGFLRILSILIPVITAADLFLAHQNLVPTVPESEYRRSSLLAEEIFRDQQGSNPVTAPNNTAGPDAGPIRVYRYAPMNPFSFLAQSDRYVQSFIWDRKTLAPKYPWPEGIGIANVYGTVVAADYARFLRDIGRQMADTGQRHAVSARLTEMGIGYFVLPLEDLNGMPVVLDGLLPLKEKMPPQYSYRTDFEKAWQVFYHDWPVGMLLWKSPEPVRRVRILRSASAGKEIEGEYANVIRYEPNRVDLSVRLQTPGSVVMNEQYWPGWTATATSATGTVLTVPIEKESGILRKITLPEGDWKVETRYQPLSVLIGLILSGIALVAMVIWGLFRFPKSLACK